MARWDRTATASAYIATSGSSQVLGTLTAGEQYVLAVSEDCYFRVTTTSGGSDASAAAGSHFIKAGDTRVISTNDTGCEVRIIQRSTAGVATLSLVWDA